MKEKASRMNAISTEQRLKDERTFQDKMEREQLLNSQMRNDEVYAIAQMEKNEEFYKNLRSMHSTNLQTEKQRLDAQRRSQIEIDKHSLETRMRIDREQDDKRANSRVEMQRRNAEYEMKVAMAAKAISRDRDLEKDKLTKINIDKTKAK